MSEPFDSTKYRSQNQRHGRLVRWWKALPCTCVDPRTKERGADCGLCGKDGHRRIEQTIPNGIDGKPARVHVYQTTVEIRDEEFGAIRVGSTAISFFPNLMPIARLDELAFVGKARIDRKVMTRGSGDLDSFEAQLVTAILSIEGYVQDGDYKLDPQGTAVRWLGLTRPAAGARYLVEFSYLPRYVCLNTQDYDRGTGSDGLPLPSEMVLVAL